MLDRSTTWPYKDGEPGEFIYQRYGHPTGVEAERRVGELDGGQALLFSSGAGATTALVLTFLSSGDTIALAEGASTTNRSGPLTAFCAWTIPLGVKTAAASPMTTALSVLRPMNIPPIRSMTRVAESQAF